MSPSALSTRPFLLIDANVRLDARVDADFVASVHDLGVLVPIVAVRTLDGGLRVRFGHRRTIAAAAPSRSSWSPTRPPTTPQIERLVTQWAENELARV
jgi:hypothetical protein